MEYDIIHEVGESKDWNESFYFNFYDRGNDLCGFMRIGLKPNKKEKSVFCYIMMPDGTMVGTKEMVEMTGSELQAKGLVFEKIEADKKWALRFDGELKQTVKEETTPVKVGFNLEFETLHEPFDYRKCVSGEKEALAKAVASEHIEQVGRITGTLTVGDREFNIKALGERDHSWGERDWTAPRFWLWVTCQVNETYAFNITKLEMDKGDVDAGFLFKDGQTLPIVKVDIAREFNADGSPQELFMAFYVPDPDEEGKLVVYGVKGVTKRKAMLKFDGEDKRHQAIMFETLTKFKVYEGDEAEVGMGIAEYLYR
ncbi:MAG TPA: hypothetical protein VLH13_01445, partial [Methanomassiliicoccales archaeon]|nr:hypothetical protein [Methanomassiliicoccales archaeon]